MRIPDLIKLSCSQCFTGNAFHLGRIVPWLAAEPPQGTAATLSPGAGDMRVAGVLGQTAAPGGAAVPSGGQGHGLSLRGSLPMLCITGSLEVPKWNCITK